MYAFLSHGSACEALRSLDGTPALWPHEPRRLPLSGACVSNLRSFKALAREVDLTCFGITTAPVDLLVPEQSMRSRGKGVRFHVWSGAVPPASMLRLADQVLVSGPELVVIQFCGSQAKLDALLDEHVRAVRGERETLGMLGLDERPVIDHPLRRDSIERLVAATVLACEFAGTYRISESDGSTRYRLRPLMTAESLGSIVGSLQGTANKARAAEVAGLFYERSASPMETALALLLTLPVEFGGMGLPRMELNAPVDVSEMRGTLAERDEVAPDILWRSARVAIEYDSAEFHELRGARQLEEDARRANILTACGYHVLRVTSRTVRTLQDVELLARQASHLLGLELDRPNDVQALRRTRLFSMLMPRSLKVD